MLLLLFKNQTFYHRPETSAKVGVSRSAPWKPNQRPTPTTKQKQVKDSLFVVVGGKHSFTLSPSVRLVGCLCFCFIGLD